MAQEWIEEETRTDKGEYSGEDFMEIIHRLGNPTRANHSLELTQHVGDYWPNSPGKQNYVNEGVNDVLKYKVFTVLHKLV